MHNKVHGETVVAIDWLTFIMADIHNFNYSSNSKCTQNIKTLQICGKQLLYKIETINNVEAMNTFIDYG